MTETEYVRAGNLAKLQAVRALLSDMLPGAEFGMSEKAWRELAVNVSDLIAGVAAGLTIEGDET